MARKIVWNGGLLAALMVALTPPASAQSLGTFRWQLQPYCNVVTVAVSQVGGVYRLDGSDDQCGAPQQAPAIGLATPNPDGSVGIGLAIVTVPGGHPVHVDARISLATLNGPWSDSAGNGGTFAFNAATGGVPRPRPTSPGGLPGPGSITTAHIAAGAVGRSQIDTGQVQARISGVCAGGQALRGVQPDGTVVCTDALTTVDDPTASVGTFSSLAIAADGRAVVSHRDATAGALRFTRCTNATCTSGESVTIDDPANDVGWYTSIAIGTDGLPIISHHDSTAGALRVTHCGNPGCSDGNVSTTVDDGADSVGLYSSIAIGADGLPIISHRNQALGALRVTHCGNVACTSGNVSTTVDDPAAAVGEFTSIAIGTDGLAIISHRDDAANGLRVTHCGNLACTSGNVSTTVDDPVARVGRYTSIAIGADGLPVISHRDVTVGGLRVTHCTIATCAGGATSTTVDDQENSLGWFTAIAIGTDGLPIISHRDDTAGALRVTHCGNAACTAGASSTTIDDSAQDVGLDTAIVIGRDGLPIVSHGDATSGTLRVARCGTRTCQ